MNEIATTTKYDELVAKARVLADAVSEHTISDMMFLKMQAVPLKSGAWILQSSPDDIEVVDVKTTKYVVRPDEATFCYKRFVDNRPEMWGDVSPLDEYSKEVKPTQPIGETPYSLSFALPIYNAEGEQLAIYEAMSKGGREAIANLVKSFTARVIALSQKTADDVGGSEKALNYLRTTFAPLVSLDQTVYKTNNGVSTTVYKPIFVIQDWVSLADGRADSTLWDNKGNFIGFDEEDEEDEEVFIPKKKKKTKAKPAPTSQRDDEDEDEEVTPQPKKKKKAKAKPAEDEEGFDEDLDEDEEVVTPQPKKKKKAKAKPAPTSQRDDEDEDEDLDEDEDEEVTPQPKKKKKAKAKPAPTSQRDDEDEDEDLDEELEDLLDLDEAEEFDLDEDDDLLDLDEDEE